MATAHARAAERSALARCGEPGEAAATRGGVALFALPPDASLRQLHRRVAPAPLPAPPDAWSPWASGADDSDDLDLVDPSLFCIQ